MTGRDISSSRLFLRFPLLAGLCGVVLAIRAHAGEVRFTFPNPRLAAHVVAHDPSVVISGIERGVAFSKAGSVTYRFAGPSLLLRGSALKEGVEVAVSADGNQWESAGKFAGHEMIDVDLKPFGEVRFVRFSGTTGVLRHPTSPEQDGPFDSDVLDIPEALRKHVNLHWAAGANRGTPISKEPDLDGTPESVRAKVLPGGKLAGGTYDYAILTTYDEGEKQRNALQGTVSVGNGGLVNMNWEEMVGGVERLAKEAKKGKEELTKELALGGEEEGKKPKEDEDAAEEFEERTGAKKAKKPPEYFYEIYRRDPGRKLFRVVHRLPTGSLKEWTDTGEAAPGKELPQNVELREVWRRKHGQPYAMQPKIDAHFGVLPSGKYAYRIAAVFPSGEMPPTAPMIVDAPHPTNEILVEWDGTRSALWYKVYRSAANDPNGQTRLVAQLAAPTAAFSEHGIVEPGDGVSAALEARSAVSKAEIDAADWREMPGESEIDLSGRAVIQFRVAAKSSPAGYLPAYAGVALSDAGIRPERPRRLADVTYRWPYQHPWVDTRPVLGAQASPARLPGAQGQITFDGRHKVNCLAVAATPGLSCIRDYDVQYYSEAANDWRPLFAVRNNDQLLRLFWFEPVETQAIRLVTFGEPLFGAYSINMNFWDCAAGLVPVCVPELECNGERLAPASAPASYNLWRPLFLLRGENRLTLKLRDVVGKDASLTLRAVSIAEGGGRSVLGEVKGIRVAADGEAQAVLPFTADAVRGWVSFELVEEPADRTFYTFQYYAQTAPSLNLELRKPDYRQTIFESQPDKTVEAEVLVGTSPDRLKDWLVGVSVVRQGAPRATLRTEFRPLTKSRWPATFDGAALPYGTYSLVAELVRPDGKPEAKVERAFYRCAPSPQAECWIGPRGLMFMDGKPVIALDMLGMGYGHFESPICDQAARLGFNVLETGSDEARARGAFTVPRMGLPRDRAGDGWYQRRSQKMNTTDPALVGRLARSPVDPSVMLYMYGDEIDVMAETGRDISAYFPGYGILKAVDPWHPALTLLFDSNGFFGRIGETCDVFCVEPYIYANYSDTRRELAARVKKNVAWTHAAVLYAQRPGLDSRKAVWAYPQNWDHRVWTGERDSRIPSVLENRCFLFFLLNEGVSGFLFYNYCTSYFHLKMNPLFWEGHRAAVQETNVLMPFLLDERLEEPAFEPDTASLSLGLFRHGKDYALIASNLDAYPVKARIRLPDAVKAGALGVLSEERTVPVADGAIEDRFEGCGSHVYTTLAELPSLPMAKILKDERYLRGPHHDTQAGNVASETTGATARANYTIWGYNSALFTIDDDRETCWNTSAWAVWGKKSGDWVEVTFHKPEKISRVVVRSWQPKYFHDYDDTDNLLTDFDLQVWAEDWRTVKEVRGNPSEVIEMPLDPVTTQKIRVVVKKGLCVAEIEAYR